MLLDLTGDSDSDRPPLECTNGDAESREVEAGVNMSWETAEARLREWDVNSRFGPCTSMTRPEGWHHAAKLDLDPPLLVYNIMETFPELDGQHFWKGRIWKGRSTLLAFEGCFRRPSRRTCFASCTSMLLVLLQ
jgi:hypothetical protein